MLRIAYCLNLIIFAGLALAQEPESTAPTAAAPSKVEPTETPSQSELSAPGEPTPTPTPPPKAADAPTPSPTPRAPEPVYVVEQIFRDKSQLVVLAPTLAPDQAPPTALVFTNEKGEACEGKLISSQDGHALVDISGCGLADQILKGANLVPAIFQPAQVDNSAVLSAPRVQEDPELERSKFRRVRVSASVGYSSPRTVAFDSVTESSASGDIHGSETFSVAGSPELNIALLYARPRQWGFLGGLTFERPREISGGTAMSGAASASFTFDRPRPTIQFSLFEFNLLYRWRRMFLPFGLNYSQVNVRPSSSAASTTRVTAFGKVGAQAGVGWIVGEYLHFEVLAQAISFSSSVYTASDSTDLGNAFSVGYVLRAGVCY